MTSSVRGKNHRSGNRHTCADACHTVQRPTRSCRPAGSRTGPFVGSPIGAGRRPRAREQTTKQRELLARRRSSRHWSRGRGRCGRTRLQEGGSGITKLLDPSHRCRTRGLEVCQLGLAASDLGIERSRASLSKWPMASISGWPSGARPPRRAARRTAQELRPRLGPGAAARGQRRLLRQDLNREVREST